MSVGTLIHRAEQRDTSASGNEKAHKGWRSGVARGGGGRVDDDGEDEPDAGERRVEGSE